MFFAQAGAEQAIRTAAETGRWEAVALAMIMITVTGFLVYLVKQIMAQAIEREKLLGQRIDSLEDYTRNTLYELVRECTQALLQNSVSQTENVRVMGALLESLGTTRTCFATGDKQTELVQIIANRVADKIKREEQ
jgi:hypothetical protein